VTAELFWSPDYSIQTTVSLIDAVPQNGWIDIGNPGWSSWNSCTWSTDDPDQCDGCSIATMQSDPFPVFPALLNAMHQRNVSVRVLTNNYNTPTCAGMIAPLDFLALNGAEVRFYTTTTYLHNKYMATGVTGSSSGRKVLISSVNYSQTSFMKNREAGVVVTDDGAGEAVVSAALAVFANDFFAGAVYNVTGHYTAAQLAQIRDPSPYPVTVPPMPNITGAYVTPAPAWTTATTELNFYVAPDQSRDQFLADLNATKASFQLFIYQVTDFGLCNKLQAMHQAGINVTLLVSAAIYDAQDLAAAKICYKQLYAAGLTPRLTPSYYSYSHQKVWVADGGAVVGLSSGNWSPTDAPWPAGGGSTYPPYPNPNWQDTNRDMNVRFVNTPWVAANVLATFDADWVRGSQYTPSWPGR
jgi:phosphatidylserine/phosphatidylglycerophosphate/cardiolipin synthase-like enzyme